MVWYFDLVRIYETNESWWFTDYLMSYNPKFFNNKKVFWKILKLGKCPILGCEGELILIENFYECDKCINFKISRKKFAKLSR